MIQLTYTSTATLTITPETVLDMLNAARRNNAPMGVTGLLYYAQGQFAQCLEGPKDAVEAIFERVSKDPRHTDLVVLRRPTLERAFSDWSMAFVDTSTAEVARILMSHHTNSYEANNWKREDVLPILADMCQALRTERIMITH